MNWLRYSLFALGLLAATLPMSAQAATCSNPAGQTGAIVFNTTYSVVQVCNTSGNWIALGGNGNDGSSELDPKVGALVSGKWCTSNGTQVTCAADAPSGALSGLTDVTLSSPSNGQILSFNGSTWVNTAPSGGALINLSDVAVSSPATGQVLSYDGSNWVNSAASGGLGDRIVSGTIEAIANPSGYISLSTASSTWGYLGSTASYLPNLTAAQVSATLISTSMVQVISQTTTIACSAGNAGALRYNSANTALELCTGTSWQVMGVGIPAGTISAFASTTCPTGWSEYTAARGRFLRGIDNGAGNDPSGTRAPGNTQADALQNITGRFAGRSFNSSPLYSVTYSPSGAFYTDTDASDATPVATSAAAASAGKYVNFDASRSARTTSETRPKNVAVTFCQFNGTSNGWNNPLSGGSTTPGGATGQIQYNTSGSFDASPNFTWTNADNLLTATNISVTALTVNGVAITGASTSDRITSGTTQAIAYQDTSLSLVTAGTERMVIGANGNVGIGQQPSQTAVLSVSGTVSFNNSYLDIINNLNGLGNVAIGYGAILDASNGTLGTRSFRTAIGNMAGNNARGVGLVAVGASAGFNNTGGNSVIIGRSAGVSNTGLGLSTLGYMASSENSGDNVTAIGFQAGTYNTFSNVTLLGANTHADKNNQVVLGSSATIEVSTTGFIKSNGIRVGGANYEFTPCDASMLGAIIYNGGNLDFQICRNGSAWENLSDTASAGASTFASLTDVSYSAANRSIFGPSSLTGAAGNAINSTAFGYNALSNASNTGMQNTAFGSNALSSNTSGFSNVAVGHGSLASNTTGRANTALGVSALASNTTGRSNIAIGQSAQANTTTGIGNIAIGVNTLNQVTTASSNVAVGGSALSANVDGSENTAVGSAALGVLRTGSLNTAVGFYAGYGSGGVSSSGIANTMLGVHTGRALYTGNSNTLVGAYAGYYIQGSSNILIGENAGAAMTTGSNNLVIGAQTTPYSNTGDNQLNIANAIWGNIGSGMSNANRIGINVPSATTALEVSGTVSATRFVGDGSGLTNLPGGGGNAGDRLISGTTSVTASQSTSISLVTNNVERMVIGADGNVGLGSQPYAPYLLNVNGAIRSTSVTIAAGLGAGMNSAPPTPFSNLALGVDTSAGYAWMQSYGNRPLSLNPVGNNVGIGVISPTTKLEVSGRVSATTVQLSNSPADACDSAAYGTIKVVNGRPHVCRQ